MPSEQSGKPAAPTMVSPSRHSWEAGAMLGPEWAMKTYHTGLAWGTHAPNGQTGGDQNRIEGLPGGPVVKTSPSNAWGAGLIPGQEV